MIHTPVLLGYQPNLFATRVPITCGLLRCLARKEVPEAGLSLPPPPCFMCSHSRNGSDGEGLTVAGEVGRGN